MPAQQINKYDLSEAQKLLMDFYSLLNGVSYSTCKTICKKRLSISYTPEFSNMPIVCGIDSAVIALHIYQ